MTSSDGLGRSAMSSPAAASGAGAVQTGSRTVTVAEHAVVCRELLQRVEQAVRLREPDRMRIDHPELLGRVTVESVFTGMALPPFDNSQMDGYAVRAEDLTGASPDAPVELPIGTTTAAGDAPVAHAPGTASPVMTGAPIPLGADAVVPIEQSDPPSFHALARAGQPVPQATVSFSAPVVSGVFVRFAGSDLERGAEILPAGSRLTPARIGAVAASGITELAVLPRVRVLICSTGDEIAHDDSAGALAPGRIHDSNAPMLAAALRAAGAEVLVLRSDDRAEALRAALATKWEWADVIVTNGGISAGAFEVVRDALTPLGADFLKVAMQPAGPQGSGLIRLPESGTDRELPVLCFPGNPVSTLLSAELFMLPTLRGLAGLPADLPREQRLLAHDTESPEGKLQLRRGNIEPDGRVSLTGPSSHLLARLATADVIAEIPLGVGFAAENTPITVWRIND